MATQTVLNTKERNRAFWKFLFFFIIAVWLIVGAIYFDFSLPSKENAVMRQQVSRYRTQTIAQEKFVASMDDARKLIDSLKTPGVNTAYINQLVAAKLRELTELQYKDSSVYSRLNKNILDVFLRYHESTNKIVELGDAPTQLADYKAKYEMAEQNLQNCRRDLDASRLANL